MRHFNIIIASVTFLLILIAIGFGASIHNANTNDLLTHLNEMDNIHYYDIEMVPGLSFRGALYTLPLVVGVLILESIIAIKSTIRQVKNIAIGLLFAILIVLICDILVLMDPVARDFSKWGYIWITMGLFIIAGNALSVFVKGNKSA